MGCKHKYKHKTKYMYEITHLQTHKKKGILQSSFPTLDIPWEKNLTLDISWQINISEFDT